jgi:MFS transporter, OFA family, oxalate/formate antiporter
VVFPEYLRDSHDSFSAFFLGITTKLIMSVRVVFLFPCVAVCVQLKPGEKEMTEQKVQPRGLVVVGAVLIQMCLGAIYAWSVFTPQLIDSGWSKVQTQVVFAVALASFVLVMVWAGRKLTVLGPKKLAWAAAAVLGIGYILAGLVGGTSFTMLLICIGVISGAGIGLGYVVPIAVGMRWFPDKKGMITGLAVAGFGFGALGWVKLAGSWGHLIENMGLSTTFIIYGIIMAVLVFIGGMFMKFPPEGWTPKGWNPPAPAAGKTAAGTVDFTTGEMLRTPQFWMLFIIFVLCAGAGLMSIGLMKLWPMEALQSNGYDAAAANAIAGTAMAVFFSICNGLGRVLWGVFSDSLGRKLSILIMASTQGIFIIAFTYLAGSEFTLYLMAALIGFNFGGTLALFAAMTADTFGTKNVGQNYPFLFLAYGLGGILGPILGGMLGDMGNFSMAFTGCGVLVIVGAVVAFFVHPPKKAAAPDQIIGEAGLQPA